MAVFEIPLVPQQAVFDVLFDDGVLTFRLLYNEAVEAGWMLDIYDRDQTPLIMGIPLVAGADLLQQYATLGLNLKLWVVTDGDATLPPTRDNLGLQSRLLYEAA